MVHQPFAVPAMAFVVLALPLIAGLVPRNRIYGIRTQRTMADDATWYRVNRVGGWLLMGAGALYLGVAAAVPYSPAGGGDFSVWLLHLAAFLGPLLATGLILRARQR